MHAQTEEQSINFAGTPVRGAIDEKNEVYKRAIEVEEGKDDDEDEDVENNQPVRPTLRIHSIRIGIVMILVVLTQALGISKVNFHPAPYSPKVFLAQMELYADQTAAPSAMVVGRRLDAFPSCASPP
jgi:hypothetical protein